MNFWFWKWGWKWSSLRSSLLIPVHKHQPSGYLFATEYPSLGFDIKKLLYLMVPLKYKNDTNTPVVLELWVLEVGPGFGSERKYLVKRQQSFMIAKYWFMVGSPKLFIMAKYYITKKILNADYQNYVKSTRFTSLMCRYTICKG